LRIEALSQMENFHGGIHRILKNSQVLIACHFFCHGPFS
jgi:hypothetical protein